VIYNINSWALLVIKMQSCVTTQAIESYAINKYPKNAQIFKFIGSLLILVAGTVAGLLINVEENKALDLNKEA